MPGNTWHRCLMGCLLLASSSVTSLKACTPPVCPVQQTPSPGAENNSGEPPLIQAAPTGPHHNTDIYLSDSLLFPCNLNI